MSTKLIVVTGVTGVQGGSVARLFAQDPNWRVRGITRHPDKPANASLREAGIELVAGDYDDVDSLDRAFNGANAIFGTTDFWQFIKDPQVIAEAKTRGKQVNEIAFEREVQQGKNIVTAAAKHVSTLDRLVLSILSNSKKWSNGEILWNLHFDGKAQYTEYMQQTYPALAAKTSYFHIGVYLSNWWNPMQRPEKQSDDTYVLHVTADYGDHPIPWVHAQHDTGYFVKALIRAPPGTAILGCSRLMRYQDYWKLWAEVKGVRLVVQVDKEFDSTGVPDWLAREMYDSKQYVSKYGWAGGDPKVKEPQEAGVEMDKLMDIERYMRETDYVGFM
ncbi:hypothetical protein AtubIFM55763_004867 [Aspergillus tubingensis]|uniref:NmrA-like domain-containing protein n=2 Tax=Aspergillus tubingensis TaxID=5068 RepID=A0A1L9MTI3_ASPTC|nr:NAD(P)-binding protein [Aspergillus tubingensis]OJI80366.1 hypothetical protein ASPTUDRAFT_204338 [Aspergillus tubingensis CBS 134.48]GFN11733.1 NAD(P)-binding protein [Aspergillus tubingensis]GLA66818.1 hypothetical protein AtubIFM54640_009404 [Aspergillus tubingensis]GLA73932.1 hypothetical protein AtubIFM55763_004867 [Aspergillus tubingensis]GLA85049.1 hypothetical protein AtubIFM56815_009273 [Aspergillus tubingensis]